MHDCHVCSGENQANSKRRRGDQRTTAAGTLEEHIHKGGEGSGRASEENERGRGRGHCKTVETRVEHQTFLLSFFRTEGRQARATLRGDYRHKTTTRGRGASADSERAKIIMQRLSYFFQGKTRQTPKGDDAGTRERRRRREL